ncbi:hypothetical protein BDV98DRAFT_440312 [Pterulicium gracile]|uniref:Uncharacterized protein n=1 Tax=Pterulicium gracile TaxID=1884261 RepID=A0A5C3Q054_9AGAR|nr:hypothetical protein BDV98DRAFT_440312 [Pterula gracilis]
MVFTRNGSTLLASAGLHPDRLEELTDLEYSDEEGIQFDGARNAEGKKIDWIDLVEGELSDLTEAEDEAERPSCVEVASQRVSSRKNARSQEKKTRFQPSRRAAIQNPSEEDNIAYATGEDVVYPPSTKLLLRRLCYRRLRHLNRRQSANFGLTLPILCHRERETV